MLLKDRVILITNVEKFAGHGTTRMALGQGATVLAHDPSFEALEAMAVAPFRLVQLVAPAMRKRKSGRIVFVSSAAPLRGIANYAPYVSARAAANGLVSSLAKELGRDGITVNAVGSNYVENPDYFPPALLANAEAMAKMTTQIPLGRLGTSEELGAAICFLCSDGAGFITGHVLPHAGGWA